MVVSSAVDVTLKAKHKHPTKNAALPKRGSNSSISGSGHSRSEESLRETGTQPHTELQAPIGE